jgi:hypothetical protein
MAHRCLIREEIDVELDSLICLKLTSSSKGIILSLEIQAYRVHQKDCFVTFFML